MRVPFVNLAQEHEELFPEIEPAVMPLLKGARFVGGPPVETFERAFAEATEVPHAVGVKSGTAALELSLEALGVRPGDEVVVPAFTFIATAATAARLGASVVFADVDPDTACLSPQTVERVLTPRTKAVIPVHLYGHPAPVDALAALARGRSVALLEDCAQSHLARLDGRAAGSFGDLAAYSFYPSKNLGAAGDAGAVTSTSADLADKVRKLANHGRTGRYDHAFLGTNERIDAIQAAVLAVKLKHLPEWTRLRRQAAARYDRLLKPLEVWGEPLKLPVTRPGAEPVHHLYVVRHSRREDLARALAERNVETGTHYPTTLPAQPAFADLGHKPGDFPVAETWASTCLALPMFPGITEDQQSYVAEVLGSLRN